MTSRSKHNKSKNSKSNKNNFSIIGFIFIFLLGSGILFYPRISFWLAERNHVVAHQSYEQSVAELSVQEKQEMWDIAVYYNERLVNSVVEDPFASTEDIDPFHEYYQTLDVGEGVMGYIRIPKIEVLLPIYHGVSEEVLEKGVGHIHATALPVGGEGTHSVLTGHTGLSSARMFNDLVDLKLEDEFYLEVLDKILAYRIISIEVVLPDDVSSLQREDGEEKVTLVTCTPYGVNSHRLLVTGERIPYTAEMEERAEVKVAFPWWIVLVILLIVGIILWIGRRAKKKNSKQGSKQNSKQNSKQK